LWPTPCANNPNEGETLESWDRRQALNKAKHNNGNGAGTPLAIKVKQELWLTPKTGDNHATKHHPQRSDGGQPNLAWQMEKEQFPTPRTCDWKSSPNADSNIKRMEVGQATLAEFVHAKHKKGDLWSTPTMPVGGRKCRSGKRKSELLLDGQAKHWGTPTARDHKSGRGNEDRQYKELTPMVERQQSGKLNPRWVETLMGLPIGWTMPSCTSPQTIAPMSCDSSAMESCLPPQSELSEFSLASCGNWTTPNQMDASIAKPALRPSRIATGRKTDYLARQVSMIQEP
jgi:hypothetical protein